MPTQTSVWWTKLSNLCQQYNVRAFSFFCEREQRVCRTRGPSPCQCCRRLSLTHHWKLKESRLKWAFRPCQSKTRWLAARPVSDPWLRRNHRGEVLDAVSWITHLEFVSLKPKTSIASEFIVSSEHSLIGLHGIEETGGIQIQRLKRLEKAWATSRKVNYDTTNEPLQVPGTLAVGILWISRGAKRDDWRQRIGWIKDGAFRAETWVSGPTQLETKGWCVLHYPARWPIKYGNICRRVTYDKWLAGTVRDSIRHSIRQKKGNRSSSHISWNSRLGKIRFTIWEMATDK